MNEAFSLLDRFTTQGTLADPKGIPDPAYSLPGTLNWMRALAILVKDEGVDIALMKKLCAAVTKGALSDRAVNTAFEQLLMSLHHLASLKAMGSLPQRIDPARSAIVTWYYGIFHAASAMIASQDGSYQENHGETANSWDSQFSGRPYIPRPFNYRVTTLVGRDVEAEIAALRGTNTFNLNAEPKTIPQAFGACMSYLKGSATWRAEYFEEDMKRRELKKLGLDSFRSAVARKLRDERLNGKALGFVHQAFRYRGKANYREALFISYGNHIEPMLANFHTDMFSVLEAFLCMAGAFCARRVGKDLWNAYLDDLSVNVLLLVKSSELWDKI
jgi:hypothetical protein